MSGKVDMSLDEIIANDRKSRGGRGGGGGRGGNRAGGRGGQRSRGGGGRPGGNTDRRNGFSPRRNDAPSFNDRGPGKLLISNLDHGVSEGDLHELFSEFGHIRTAIIHYDRYGQSLGSGEVGFDRKSDAIKGMKRYNGVPLDGKPMRIEIAGSERDLFEPVRRTQNSGIGQRRDRGGGNRQGGGGRRGGTPRGGGSQRGGRGGPRKENAAPVSKEDLDQEMEQYMSSKSS